MKLQPAEKRRWGQLQVGHPTVVNFTGSPHISAGSGTERYLRQKPQTSVIPQQWHDSSSESLLSRCPLWEDVAKSELLAVIICTVSNRNGFNGDNVPCLNCFARRSARRVVVESFGTLHLSVLRLRPVVQAEVTSLVGETVDTVSTHNRSRW